MRQSIKISMLEHSKAKVDLYQRYLSIYLHVLSRFKPINKIHIYDLMCGEGIYENNSEGSPIAAIKTIKEICLQNNSNLPKIEVWFNDRDKSEIEPDKYKIDRIQEYCSKTFLHERLNITYSKNDYSHLHSKILSKIKGLESERFLLFIDPYGYKEIEPEYLKKYLENKNTEILLFLPISYMYRFANKALNEEEFAGGEALKKFLNALFKRKEIFSSSDDFIEKLKTKFYEYFDKKIFVDNFKIKRDSHNIYCLFFFTPHIRGFEKMLEAKWKIDEQNGRGFELNKTKSLFSSNQHIKLSDYPSKLESYIKSKKYVTNKELYAYGLKNGFLPKHTNKILRKWRKNSLNSVKVYSDDGNEVIKNASYISYKPKKEVRFTFNWVNKMATSKIEWTAETWNPTVGCTKISAGCQNCYAEVMAKRLQAIGVLGYENGFKLTLMPQRLSKPLKKKKPTTYFVNSMSDLFHKDIPDVFLNRVFEVMEKTPRHTYQILTKRAERMERYLKNKKIPSNIWLGVTAENKKDGLPRIEILRKINSSIKFISIEPMLENMGKLNFNDINWVIVGGESGAYARPMESEWVMDIKKECKLQNKAFFFKQWGTWGADGIKRNKKSNGRRLLGKEWNQYPTVLNMGQAYA